MASVDLESGTKFCKINFGKFSTPALVDSGADISLISSKTLKKVKPEFILQKHAPLVQLKGVTGHWLNVLARVMVKFKIGKKLLTHEFHVVQDLSKSMILGIDFMEKQNATVDFGKKTLAIGDQIVVLRGKTGRTESRVCISVCE